VVTKLFSVSDGDEDIWSEITTKKFDANANAYYILFQVLYDDDIARVIHCQFIYEIWSHLVVTYVGTL